YNTFENNHIVNGHTAIKIPNPGIQNRVLNNNIDSTYSTGLHIFNQDSLEVIGNNIDASSAGNPGSFGTYFQANVNSVFEKNFIHSNSYGLLCFSSENIEMINNMVISEAGVGIYITNTDTLNIFHNS